MRLERSSTTALSRALLGSLRELLELSYLGDFSADDWSHTLGGVHVLAWEDARLIGHGALVPRTLLTAGRAWNTGYVEAVAVRPGHRRRGVASAIMALLEEDVRARFELGALSPSDEALPLYRARSWQPWRGPTFASIGAHAVRTPDEDGNVFVFTVRDLPALDGELTCDARSGDPW
ncbi:MAG: GNAT family N-acetyltransferase [Myxococcaceae bacterium]|nr:GNAT family N-acetyltransferase [Myxococcaceae bacterium]